MKTYLTMMKRINMNTVIARLLLLLISAVATLQLAAQNLNTPNKRGPMGVEVNTFSGNLFLPRTDIRIPARSFTISVSFFYNSYNYDVNEGFGKGWLFAYHIRYRNDSAGAKTILWGDGREDTYEAASGGTFKSPPGFFNILTAYQPSKLLLTEKDGTKYYFDNAVHRRITRMEEPNGNYFTFTYTDSLLTSITSKAGQSVSFAYTNGRLTSATDGTASPARVYNYTYDEAGHLTKVTDPLGGTNLYTYLVNGPVKTVTDRNSNVIDVIYYNDLSVSEVIGCNKRISFSYDTTTHISYVTEHMNDGQNQVTKYEYKNAGNRFWLAAVSGNCCGFSKKFEFDDNGNKVKETDANGQVYTYTYDARGNLLTVKDPLGQLKKYTYSTDFSKLTGYTDPKGNAYTITYDAKGNITQFTEPGNNVYTATYNTNGDIISATDAKGLAYTYDYDTYGNLSAVNGPNGYHATFTHDPRGNLLSLTNGRNNTYTAEYDFLDRVKKVTDPLNDAIRFSYDAEGNPVSFSNKNNETFSLGYDASNRIVKLTDPAGAQRRFSYNAMDNLTGITNPLGYAKTFSYDTRNRFSGLRDELNNNVTLSYDANGNITGISLPTGEQISCSYDNLNRIISAQDATGTLGAYTYDGNNNITSITNASGAVTTLTWDNLNRLTKATDPLGNSAAVVYDKNGNVTSITDRNGFTRSYTYDDLNRMKTYTGNNGDVMTVDYDGEGNIAQVKDANNNITSYTYDNLNRVSTITYPDGKYIQLTYDKKSNVTAKRLTDGTVISFQYDAVNRLISKTLPGGNVFTYTYDAAGRLLTATNNAGTVTFEYDAKDRVVSETFAGLTVRYTYNVQGRTQTTIYPDNTVVTQNYDMRNRLTSIVKNNQPVVTYQYNNSNQVVSKVYGNGVNTSLQYDFANRLSSLSTAAGAIQQSSFTYDKERNKTAITRLNPAFSEQFTYDNGYRIKTHKLGSTDNSYQYDAQGNRTSTVLNGVSSSYTANNLNQLTGVSGGRNISFTYDNNGNLTYDGLFYKKYDAEGRLLKDSSSPSNVLTYLYDAVGRRVQKVSNGTVYNYTFSGLSQIEERNGAGVLAARTVFADFMSPVLLEKNSNGYYYHADDHYSIEAITDVTGNLAERYQYDAFGKPVIYDAAGNVINTPVSGNRFGFTGQLYDSASGNYRFHYRDYSPVNGVFNQRDPLGYGDGMAMYQYVHNNPANGIDILGLQDCPPPPTTVDPPQDIWSWLLYGSGLLGNSADITSVLQEYGMVANGLQKVAKAVTNTGLGVLLTIPNAIGTANTARDLGSNWDSYSNGQRVDGIISLGSGSLSTGLGITTAGYTANGLMAGQGLTASLGSAGAAVTATTSGAVLVGVGGGLAIYGLTNEMVKALTGRSIAEHGEAAEIPLFTSGVRTTSSWWYTKKVKHGEGWTQENQEKWDRIRQRIENGERLRPKQDCPQNNDPNGPQRNGPGGGGGQNGFTHVVASFDPNEIIGPDGMPDKRWVSVNDRLPYTILFENDKSASAPAKYVKVVLPFHEKMDPASFQLGTFGFNSLTFTIAPGTASTYQRLDCRDSLGLYVDMTAGYDVLKNQAFWEFQSIDPVTLLPPSDPLKGFLLLQDTAKLTSGHGFVNFSIKPVSTARTLDSILATANIVFDSNDTIPTNITRNTIDAVAPVSHLNSMPANVTNMVSLSWNGADDANGSGLHYYTLYVSTDGINYQIVRSGITRTDTTFSSKPGNRYYFFVLATDSVGNTEVLRPGEVKSVYIGTALPVTWLYFNGSTQGKNNILDWATASEQNSKEFRVERSFDGVNFTGIGVVASRGSVAAGSTYQYTDYNIDKLNSKVMYYRLKQVDIDGNFKYSGIVRLTYDVKDRTASLVYPNPTQGLVTVVVGDSKLVGTEAHVYDEGGKLLEVVKLTSSSQLFNLGKYQNGVYFIRLSNQEILKVIKRS